MGFRIAGIHAGTKRGRVSSPLIAFRGLTGETESGRVYHLAGEADPATAALIMASYAEQWPSPQAVEKAVTKQTNGWGW